MANHPTDPTAGPTAGLRQEELLFGSPDQEYARYRPSVPEPVAWLPADTMTGVSTPTSLDVGAGTDQVAALPPARPRLVRAELINPSKAQLDAATNVLRPLLEQCTAALHAVPAERFDPQVPTSHADMITCCRASHRVDRPAVSAMADRVAGPHATVAITGDGSLWTLDAAGATALQTLIQSHLGPARRVGTRGPYAEPDRQLTEQVALTVPPTRRPGGTA
ncbi:methyltransferase [Streptomyces sp. 2A115]|uniref:methyltransferase n=1 Tax=Streptomyces sp. 2A115 TaxID=3457439 RepID=UPI003FD34B3C